MAEQDTGAQTSAPSSIEDRMSSFFKSEGEPPQPEPPAPIARETAPVPDAEVTDDVTLDDLPAEDEAEAPTSADADLELTYNGEPLKVSRDEAKNLAQLGYQLQQQRDKISSELQQGTQQAQQIRQAVEQQVKLLPELRNLDLEVYSLAQQLQSVDQNALAALAVNDPHQYLQVRAQIDQVNARYQQAAARRETAFKQYEQAQQQTQQQVWEAERQMLQRLVPVFKDETKSAAAQQQVAASLKGARQQTVEAISNNAELMAMAYKAARYDDLQASKRQKLQTAAKAPPVVRPGTGQNVADSKQEQAQRLRTQLRKSGSVDDAARLFAQRFAR